MNRTLRLGIIGLGTVGTKVVQTLLSPKLSPYYKNLFKIEAICAKDKDKKRDFDKTLFRWIDDPLDLVSDPDVDVVLELMRNTTEEIETDVCFKALQSKKHLITGNKMVLSNNLNELAKIAETNETYLGFEAAILGSTPVLQTLKESILPHDVTRLFGIISVTCNFILSQMTNQNQSFKDALIDAQKRGFGELDTHIDLEGVDAARKLSLLTALTFKTKNTLPYVQVEGIQSLNPIDLRLAFDLKHRVKLIAYAEKDNHLIRQNVSLYLVPFGHDLANIEAQENVIIVEGDLVGKILFEGDGAGSGVATSAVFSDLLNLARQNKFYPLGIPSENFEDFAFDTMDNHSCCFYVRLSGKNIKSDFQELTHAFQKHNITIKEIIQKDLRIGGFSTNIAIITHEIKEKALKEALSTIPHIKTTFIRVLD